MKQGTLITRIIILVLFFGVAAYFGVYIWRTMVGGITTTSLYSYTAERTVQASGWFFRDETVLGDGGDQTEVLFSDGEAVGAGNPVARIYSSDEGYETQKQLDEAKSTLESLNYILSRTGESADTKSLDDDIADALTGLRHSVATGDLSRLDTDADELRSLIFRRDYTYNGTDSLQAQIDETQALVDQLTAQSSNAYTTVTAPAAGLFSGTVDGYENVMTMAALESLTPSGLEALAGQGSEAGRTIGKIITSSGWYFSCNLSEEEAEGLYEGVSVTVRFASVSRDLSAVVNRVSDPENGQVNVTFCGGEYASLLTGLRQQEASIITESTTGFRVPKKALRVNQDEDVDTVGQLGIYRVSGARAKWVPVKVLWEEEDYYLIAQDYDYETDESGNTVQVIQSEYEKANNLRAGDTIIVKGRDIYNGKVVTD